MSEKMQRFDPVGRSDRQVNNICLYPRADADGNAHLSHSIFKNPLSARMGYVDWQGPYPWIRACLVPTGAGPNGIAVLRGPVAPPKVRLHPFAPCPELPRSFISESIARQFRLLVGNGIPQLLPVPLVALVSQRRVSISSSHSAWASIDIRVDENIRPPVLPKTAEFQFIVLCGPRFRDDVAILGRDVLNHILLLYRGDYRAGTMAPPSGVGRVYFGRDTGE